MQRHWTHTHFTVIYCKRKIAKVSHPVVTERLRVRIASDTRSFMGRRRRRRRRRRCQGRLIPMRPLREVSWAAPLLGPACVNPRMHAWQGVVIADAIVVAEGARPHMHGAGLLWLRRLRNSLMRCLSCLRWCLRCSTARSRGRFLPFAWLFAAKPLHENGTDQPCQWTNIAL